MGDWSDAVSDEADVAIDAWLKFKKEHPKTALALSVLPVTGQLTAIAEYSDAMKRGDSVDGVLAALQFAPGGGIAKGLKLAGEAGRDIKAAQTWTTLARMPPPAGMTAARASRISEDMAARNTASAVTNGFKALGATSTDVADGVDFMKSSGAWAAAKGSN